MTSTERQKVYDKEYKSQHRAKIRRQQAEWRAKNPDKCAVYIERQKDYKKQWVRDNRDKVNASGRKKARERRALVTQAKSRPCADCGIQYPPEVMDLDHVRGEKSGNISALAAKASVKRLLAEIDKCEVRCANCHRLRHLNEKTELQGEAK